MRSQTTFSAKNTDIRAPDESILSYLSRHEGGLYHGIKRQACIEDQVLVHHGNRSIKLVRPVLVEDGLTDTLSSCRGTPSDNGLLIEGGLSNALEPLRDVHIFSACELDRVYGLLYMEKSFPVARVTWPDWEANSQVLVRLEAVPLWSIGLIWVCPGHRRQGWARGLIATALAYFQLTPAQVGWKLPFSSPGQAIAKAICPQGFVVGI